jgi:hypothetical protein
MFAFGIRLASSGALSVTGHKAGVKGQLPLIGPQLLLESRLCETPHPARITGRALPNGRLASRSLRSIGRRVINPRRRQNSCVPSDASLNRTKRASPIHSSDPSSSAGDPAGCEAASRMALQRAVSYDASRFCGAHLHAAVRPPARSVQPQPNPRIRRRERGESAEF